MKYSVPFWRAKTDNTGTACIVEYTEGSGAAWLNFAPQNGEKSFDWSRESKMAAKLSATELGLIVAVCNGRIEGLGKKTDKGFTGLVHKTNDGQDTAIISLSPASTGDPTTRFLGLSTDRGGNKRRMSVALGTGDLENLRILCERAMFDLMLQEAYQGGNGQESQQAPVAAKPAAKPAPAKPAVTGKPVAKKPTPQPVEQQEDEESVPL